MTEQRTLTEARIGMDMLDGLIQRHERMLYSMHKLSSDDSYTKDTGEKGRDIFTAQSGGCGSEVAKTAEPIKPADNNHDKITSAAFWRRQFKAFAKNLWFYAIIAVIALVALQMTDASGGAPRKILGYSGMTVLTQSMQSEIPKGSFILVRNVNPGTLQIGDDITYMRSERTTITHRIVDIMEDYAETGKRGFITQGVDNSAPDANVVIADNVVGKVVFHNYDLGLVLEFIRENLLLTALLCVMIVRLIFIIAKLLVPEIRTDES